MNETRRLPLSFPVGRQRFNYRVAGIAIRDGHVLVCREDDDDYVMLPGGRVEMGERSDTAMEREMEEELGLPVGIGPLLLTSESFYERDQQHFHELCFFYRIVLPDSARPNGQSPWLSRPDEGHMLHFDWVALDGDGLERSRLLPAWLQPKLSQLQPGLEHIVSTESQG